MASIDISPEEISSFHSLHFSSEAVTNFGHDFLGPVEEEIYEEDDGLGYYADGVKRTLTDEQIQIFRHSEIETLLRERRHAVEATEFGDHDTTSNRVDDKVLEDEALEDGEMEDTNRPIIGPIAPSPTVSQAPPSKKKKKNKNKNKGQRQRQNPVEKGFFKANVKPDLRKRTWDKVETGLEDLQYDDMEGDSTAAPSHAAQRRKISYDDD